MNFWQASIKKNESDKIRRKSWPKERYFGYAYYGDDQPTTLEDLLSDDWEIVE